MLMVQFCYFFCKNRHFLGCKYVSIQNSSWILSRSAACRAAQQHQRSILVLLCSTTNAAHWSCSWAWKYSSWVSFVQKTLKYSQSWDLEGIQWIYTDAAPVWLVMMRQRIQRLSSETLLQAAERDRWLYGLPSRTTIIRYVRHLTSLTTGSRRCPMGNPPSMNLVWVVDLYATDVILCMRPAISLRRCGRPASKWSWRENCGLN